jgi:tRNA(Arg) A34 adenosine deaminase TadA
MMAAMHTTQELALRRTFAVGSAFCRGGEHPSGAVLVGPDGKVLLEERMLSNSQREDHGRAERILAGKARERYDSAFLLDCTLYSSAEPSVACAGAAYVAGIGRVVFGMPPGSWQ